MQAQIITKFGGTSVSSRANWEHIAAITNAHLKEGKQPIVVCSALSQTSNQLEKLIEAALVGEFQALLTALQEAHQKLAAALEVDFSLIEADLKLLEQWLTGIALLQQAPAKIKAQIMSLGELMMTRFGQAFLVKQGLQCEWFDARQLLSAVPSRTGEAMNYLAARCDTTPQPAFKKKLSKQAQTAWITQGFIASNEAGETVLLGRGGSDTSAGLMAAILEAEACEIWTDVPGIYSANPHQLPEARLLKQLDYDEAQEIASMGAKVLHPNCIPPVKRAGIPLYVKYTPMPAHSGTCISQKSDEQAPLVKSIQVKQNVTLISIDTFNMWQQVGFLADVFQTFKSHGFSVDLLSSSEFNVTVTLDAQVQIRSHGALNALVKDLNALGRAQVIEGCSAVSLVGHQIRTMMPQLSPILEAFEGQQIYLMSLASNDLNVSFVVNEQQADKISQKLHALLIENNPQSMYYSKSFQEEFGHQPERKAPWWEEARSSLLKLAQKEAPCYVYHRKTIQAQAERLKAMRAIDTLYYAIKANPHPEILKALHEKGVRFECVSIQELEHVRRLFPDMPASSVLFTPNFAKKAEYVEAIQWGCHITVDNFYPLKHWPEVFKNQPILLRLDPGCGAGHHKYVCTGGSESKFGIPLWQCEELIRLAQKNQYQIVGLHVHSGSGILTPDLWAQTASLLTSLLNQFPDVNILNLGGGLGIVDKPAQSPLDLDALDAALLAVKAQAPQIQFWLEPGRFFVAESGVILAHVTQCKSKGKVNFIGIETGMNTLVRPALYGAYHEIVNLTRLEETKTQLVHIVGPICESGDTLGYDRWFPQTQENDVVLVANAGAYGHCMSSFYNLRPPAQEVIV